MCVHFRYGLISRYARSFSWKPAPHPSVLAFAFHPHHVFGSAIRICLDGPYPACTGYSVSRLCWPSPSLHCLHIRYRNIHLLSIGYAFRPRLRPRLTQSGRTFLWNPWVSGAQDSHLRAATHTGILSSRRSTCHLHHASPLSGTLPYHYL